MNQLHQHIELALKLGQNGKHTACRKELREIYQFIKNDPLLMWNDSSISQLGKAIILMIHLELIDNEDKNIGLAHLAYLYISKGIQLEQKLQSPDTQTLFRIRKDRVILLKNFDDFFADSLIFFYFADNKAINRDQYNEQRKAVLSRMPLLPFADIYLIEQDYPNLMNDEFLLELSNYIESENSMEEEKLKEGLLLHKILYGYAYNQVKENKIDY